MVDPYPILRALLTAPSFRQGQIAALKEMILQLETAHWAFVITDPDNPFKATAEDQLNQLQADLAQLGGNLE